MSLFNICDKRTSTEKTRVDAVYEVDCEDWESLGLRRNAKSWTTWVTNTTVYEISMTAGKIRGLVTVHLYDTGNGLTGLKKIHPYLKDKPYDSTEAFERKKLNVY